MLARTTPARLPSDACARPLTMHIYISCAHRGSALVHHTVRHTLPGHLVRMHDFDAGISKIVSGTLYIDHAIAGTCDFAGHTEREITLSHAL